MLDAKTEVFTLISEKDELTIDKSHKKYEWLKGQEAGRIVKISEKGRWNSSRDYNNLYQSIKPKRKAPKKQKIATWFSILRAKWIPYSTPAVTK